MESIDLDVVVPATASSIASQAFISCFYAQLDATTAPGSLTDKGVRAVCNIIFLGSSPEGGFCCTSPLLSITTPGYKTPQGTHETEEATSLIIKNHKDNLRPEAAMDRD